LVPAIKRISLVMTIRESSVRFAKLPAMTWARLPFPARPTPHHFLTRH